MPSDSSMPRDALTVLAWRSKLATVLVGLFVFQIVAIGGYEYFHVQSALDPENLADQVEETIEDAYPEFRQALLDRIEKNAPPVANAASTELIASMPEFRQELEAFTSRQIDRAIEEGTEFSAEQFRDLLQHHREDVIATFEALDAIPEGTHQSILTLENRIEQLVGIEVARQAQRVVAIYRALNDKLERLADPSALLEPRELLERQIVRILKTLLMQQTAESHG